MKPYAVEFSFALRDVKLSYDQPKVINVSISENLPINVDPEKYFRGRIAEELKRAFSNLSCPIENYTEEALASLDPLTDTTL